MGPGSDSGPRIPRRNAVRQSDDEYESRGLLNRPLVVGPVALLVAAAVIIPLVILGSGGSSGGHQKQTARSSDETYAATPSVPPTGFASPPVHSPLPSPVETTASPKAKPKAKVEPKVTPAGVTVTVTAQPPRVTTTVIASPPLETAADAVNRLARRDPSGRHICYRAYVSGTGWQDPVCDGTIAGTTGRNLPIKAINIASYGVGGSAANAFLHDPKSTNGQGHWQPSWTAIKGNGQNLYIGSTKRNAPAVLGFAINVGNGQVCQVARLHNYNWGQQFCTKPRPDFTFGGTLDNNVWLEAVKFTV
jgi:hydrophobic W protein